MSKRFCGGSHTAEEIHHLGLCQNYRYFLVKETEQALVDSEAVNHGVVLCGTPGDYSKQRGAESA